MLKGLEVRSFILIVIYIGLLDIFLLATDSYAKIDICFAQFY